MPANPTLLGTSRTAGLPTQPTSGETFHAFNPSDGSPLDPAFHSATPDQIDQAVAAALDAAPILAQTSGADRASLLRGIADALDAAAEPILARANLETALPRPRLTGELARTSSQLRLFATLLDEGSWVNARIDTADPTRTPPKPDLRSMLRPLGGPVVVFGASNFPLAFSVAGGDTASALAAGNPVLVKAHPAHPGTSELVGAVLAQAIHAAGLPPGTFSLLFDSGTAVGTALVQHPGVRAVGFTGSYRAGRALMDLAAARPDPIPVFAEMGSTNPVFILPGALAARAQALAEGLHGSFTLGAGQFCTKPGLVFLPTDQPPAPLATFTETLRSATTSTASAHLLTAGIADHFGQSVVHLQTLVTAAGATSPSGFAAQSALLEVDADTFLSSPHLSEEIFGPATLVVRCPSPDHLLQAARGLHGHLTATILATDDDLHTHADLLHLLQTKVGRIIINGYPTGVEVNHAQVHGGPFPATSDGRSTSVGTLAILRFVRPVAFQNHPQFALPPELQDTNPLRISRLWNGTLQPTPTP